MDKPRVKEVREYIMGLHVPAYAKEQFGFIKKWLNPSGVKLRKIAKSDEGCARMNILIIDTAGKGVIRSFKGYRIMKADFARIGKKYADVYLYEDGELGTPCRIDIESAKYSIIL